MVLLTEKKRKGDTEDPLVPTVPEVGRGKKGKGGKEEKGTDPTPFFSGKREGGPAPSITQW